MYAISIYVDLICLLVEGDIYPSLTQNEWVFRQAD